METFRCYALDGSGAIVAAENIEAENQADAIKAAWDFVAKLKKRGDGRGLEIWQGSTTIFTSTSESYTDCAFR